MIISFTTRFLPVSSLLSLDVQDKLHTTGKLLDDLQEAQTARLSCRPEGSGGPTPEAAIRPSTQEKIIGENLEKRIAWWHRFHSSFGSLSNHDGNANENVAWKYLFTLLVVLRGYSNSFNLFNVAKLTWNIIGRNGVQDETENATFADMSWRSLQNHEFGHFSLLFCRGRRRNVPKVKMPVQVTVLLIKSYCFMTFSLPSPSYLLKLPIVESTPPFLPLLPLSKNKKDSQDKGPLEYGDEE